MPGIGKNQPNFSHELRADDKTGKTGSKSEQIFPHATFHSMVKFDFPSTAANDVGKYDLGGPVSASSHADILMACEGLGIAGKPQSVASLLSWQEADAVPDGGASASLVKGDAPAFTGSGRGL